MTATGRACNLALTQVDLGLVGTERYIKAEVTSGGVPLGELDRRTLESKLLPGLYCCGEVVNVTGLGRAVMPRVSPLPRRGWKVNHRVANSPAFYPPVPYFLTFYEEVYIYA